MWRFLVVQLYRGMLVGKSVEVVGSTDKSLIGKNGVIVEETKNTIALLTGDMRHIRLSKSVITMKMNIGTPKESRFIDGKQIVGTHADRIKS